MQIKVSKTFANYVNMIAREEAKQFRAGVIECLPGIYSDDRDYNYETGKVRVLVVSYPYNFYAVQQRFSTSDLEREFRRRGVRDEQGLRAMIIDLFEV